MFYSNGKLERVMTRLVEVETFPLPSTSTGCNSTAFGGTSTGWKVHLSPGFTGVELMRFFPRFHGHERL
jgi:hypothetical protein